MAPASKRRKIESAGSTPDALGTLPLHPAFSLKTAPDPLSSIASSSSTQRAYRSSVEPLATPPYGGVNGSAVLGETLVLEGYRAVRVLANHYDDTVVCSAISTARGDLRVWIKLSLSANPQAAAQFKSEVALLSYLHNSGINNVTKILGREAGRFGTMLVVERERLTLFKEIFLPPDRSPAPHWTEPSSILRPLDLCIKLVRIVSSIHDTSVVHSAIRPSSVSSSIFSEVHVHDFSCALKFGPEGTTNSIRDRGRVNEESLPYLSPECSGRVGRTGDYRSDYYSIGASMFEIFVGHTPFHDVFDPLEIIHAHIARRPLLASHYDSSIPEPLALIIAKLLEKSPDARYQTSQGLIVDLEKVVELVRQRSSKKTLMPSSEESSFVVGSIDEAAHFRLPPSSKLFGREESVEKLLASFARVEKTSRSEIVIIKGQSGIGKSSLVEMVRNPVLRSRGCYTLVKFDQIKSPVPFFAIQQALSSLLRQVLSESVQQLALWRQRLSDALGKEGRILADVLPTLENVFEPGWLDSLPPVVPVGPAESENRFQSVVRRVLMSFAKPGKPLVVGFDDLQWTTPADIAFISSLISKDGDPSSASASLLVLCVYRDNEVGPDHIVTTSLLPQLPPHHLSIKLEPLTLANIMAFISESLRKPVDAAGGGDEPPLEDPNNRPLAELILEKTCGSPLFVKQLLKALNAEGLFTFDFALGHWAYDLDLIASKSKSADIVSLLQAQMRKFRPATQDALKVAACIGNEEISATTLAVAAQRSLLELVMDLHEAVEAGLLIPLGEVPIDGRGEAGERRGSGAPVPQHYKFFHDRCQQAAYALVPVDERSAMHYQIGERLVAATSEAELDEQIFDLSNQLNYGVFLLPTSDDRDRLARFNHLAGAKAVKSTAFEAARNYLSIAWDLLGPDAWGREYELMSQVTELLIEVEYSLADYSAAQEFVRIFLAHSQHTIAKLAVYAQSIRCATATGDSLEALAIGREGLAMVGIVFPSEEEDAARIVRVIREELQLTPAKIKALSDLPRITDPIASGALAILANLVAPTYFVRIDLLGALSSLSIQLTVKHGLGDAGAFVLTLYAVLVADQFQEHEEGLALGEVAVGFFERYGATPLACPTFKVHASHVCIWSRPMRETLPVFRQSVAYGIEYRDAEYLGFGSAELCSYSLLAGLDLADLANDLERFCVVVRNFRNELSSLYISVVHQATLCLVGKSDHPCEIEGTAFSTIEYRIARDKNYLVTLHVFHLFRLMISLFFNDKVRARQSILVGRECIHGGQGLVFPAFFKLFEAVVLYDDFANLTQDERATLVSTAEYFEGLAKIPPANFGHMLLWLRAEEARSREAWVDAVALYDQAILAATEAEFVHLAACMNERCAAMLKAPKLAAGYLLEAHSQWSSWGCLPKVHALEVAFPAVFPNLTPVTPNNPHYQSSSSPSSELSPSSPGIEAHHLDAASDTERSYSNRDEIRPSKSTSSQHSQSERGSALRSTSLSEARTGLTTQLDLRAVVCASSVLASESSVDGVVSKLLALALRTAGAELCLLVLDKAGTLCAEAITTSDSSEVKHLRRMDSIDADPEKYPCSVVNYVARTRATVTSLSTVGGTDPYLKLYNPKSILCLPLSSQQRIIGVLYLSNRQTENAFTPDRLEILSLISGQAASTIEKARLVHDLKLANSDLKRSQSQLETYNRNLEETVTDRTLELRDKNHRLVAEIAEKEQAQAEMRTAKDVAEAATSMKSQFLANMSHEIRTPFNAVVVLSGLLLDTPLTPLQSDYIQTIRSASHQLLVVVDDILDYSKVEMDHLEINNDPVQLRSALEEILDMCAERAASKGIELALVLEEGDINVISDVTRLRQIIVNLLSNAVKFTPQGGEIIVTASAEQVEQQPDQPAQSRVRVSVKDNGIGIDSKDFCKLFKVFSQVEGTTLHFGGTGLGLALSRKLARLLQGDITVESELGRGSTFTVEFVAPTAAPLETDPYSGTENRDLAGKRCLVVDSNKATRGVLQQLLSSFGLEVEAPEDFSLAFAITVDAFDAKEPFDVILVDAFLPDFGAQTLLRRLRQRGIDSAAIALTRMGSPIHEVLQCFDCKFLIKPIKRNRLLHTLRQVFPAGEERKPSPVDRVVSPFPTNLAARNPLSILCAEDNPVNVKVISHLLKRMGYTTEIAENGQVAIDKALKKRYDLILMDVNMPVLDGLSSTRRLVELIPDVAIRPLIVAMTANSMAGDREQCLAAGCDGYVSKPILVPNLVGALTDAYAKVVRARPSLSEENSSSAEPDVLPGLAGRRAARLILAGGSGNSSPSTTPPPGSPS